MSTLPRKIGFAVALAAVALAGILFLRPRVRPPRNELHLFCGAALRPVVEEMIALFKNETGVRIRADYGASNLLLGRIRVGGHGDLFLPGDAYYVERAAADGRIAYHRDVAAFVPAILVARGNPLQIDGLADLAREGVRLGLADERSAAIGRLARQILEQNEISMEAIARNRRLDSVTAPELVAAVELGHIDAAIAWKQMALDLGRIEAVEIPEPQNRIVPIRLAVLSASSQPEWARRFVDFVASESGRTVFRKHGYGGWHEDE